MNRKLKRLWYRMMRRCYYAHDKSYKYYGARGVRVCSEWEDFQKFISWATSRWSEGLTLDRVKNDGNYSPDNCRFVSQGVNNCNRGKQNNNTSGYIGVTYRKTEGNWESRIRYRGKAYQLGRFGTAKEALEARNAYIVEHALPFPLQD